jgi:hypothetical protein
MNVAVTVALAFLLGAGAATVSAAGKVTAEDYPVPGHGELRLQVPEDWQVRYVYTEDGSMRPTLQVFPLEGAAFQMTVTVYWHDGMDRDITSAESLRDRVQRAGTEALPSSTDKELDVVPIEGIDRAGFLYDLHDANALDEEYHYLTQGALVVGQLVLAFTIVTDERPSSHREDCLQLLRTARQEGAHQSISLRLHRLRVPAVL